MSTGDVHAQQTLLEEKSHCSVCLAYCFIRYNVRHSELVLAISSCVMRPAQPEVQRSILASVWLMYVLIEHCSSLQTPTPSARGHGEIASFSACGFAHLCSGANKKSTGVQHTYVLIIEKTKKRTSRRYCKMGKRG